MREARERALAPGSPVLENRRPRILRRVTCTERLGPAGVGHRVAVAPVEIAVPRPRRERVQAAADVAAQVRPVGVRKRGNVDAADVLRRRLEEVRRTRRGRARSAGREHENGAEQKCLHARIVTPRLRGQGVTRPGDLSLPLLGDSGNTLASFRAGKPAQTSGNLPFEGRLSSADQSCSMTTATGEVRG